MNGPTSGMASSTDAIATIIRRALAAHYATWISVGTWCTCGVRFLTLDEHATHLAERVAAALTAEDNR